MTNLSVLILLPIWLPLALIGATLGFCAWVLFNSFMRVFEYDWSLKE